MPARTVKSAVLRKVRNDFSPHEQPLLDFIRNADPADGIPLQGRYSGIRVWSFSEGGLPCRIYFDYDSYHDTVRVLDVERC